MPQDPLQITCSDLFTPGRACPLTAVVLHEFKSGIENLDHEMCRCIRPRPLTSPGCHTSFHYGISGNCIFHQYVADADTAWGFYFIPTPACPEPPCPIEQTCDGIGADQYNPEPDGTLPVPAVVAGPDNTANCAVIHVAIATGAASTSSGIYCIGSPSFSEFAYRCLVQSLCYIFETNALVPNGYVNLLTHIGELVDLDLDQLAIDIQECLDFVPPPLPPCDCAQTPITVVDSESIDFTASGVDNHTITADVLVSATAGNTLTINPDGLFVPTAADTTVIAVTDTPALNLSVVEAPADTWTISGVPVISATPGNQLSIAGDGLLVPTLDPVLETGAGNIDVSAQVALGVQVFIVDANGGAVTLINPPDAAGLRKDIWIKNVDGTVLTVNSADLIDGQAAITLDGVVVAGYPFGNDGGEAVHLVWLTVSNTWKVL